MVKQLQNFIATKELVKSGCDNTSVREVKGNSETVMFLKCTFIV